MIDKIVKRYRKLLEAIFAPKDVFETVEDIPMKDYALEGYKTVFLDVDNTLMTYEEREVSLQIVRWVQTLKTLGFTVYLVSNNPNKKRIERVAKQLEVTGLYFALKPFTYAMREWLKDHGINPRKSIVIGDQLFKDVVLGNWLRMATILVNPIDIKTSFIKTAQRELEIDILKEVF